MNAEVHDNPDESRYEVLADGQLAGVALYRLRGGEITFFHTEIEPEYEGEGLGGQLARAALDDVRERRLSVIPLCAFIAGYIGHHRDQYLELVVPAMRAGVTQ